MDYMRPWHRGLTLDPTGSWALFHIAFDVRSSVGGWLVQFVDDVITTFFPQHFCVSVSYTLWCFKCLWVSWNVGLQTIFNFFQNLPIFSNDEDSWHNLNGRDHPWHRLFDRGCAALHDYVSLRKFWVLDECKLLLLCLWNCFCCWENCGL